MSDSDGASFLPLSPAYLHILLSLLEGDRHGYAMMLAIAKHSHGQYKIGPGTLYDNLQKMLRQGFVEQLAPPPDEVDVRRRYYRLTKEGKSLLAAEIARLEDVVRYAKAQIAGWASMTA